MKVIPVEGRNVRDPRSMQLLPAEGRDVRDGDPFWLRRVRDGDVTVAGGSIEAARSARRRIGRHNRWQSICITV